MDLSSLKNMLMNRPSLTDYLGGGDQTSQILQGQRQATQAKIARLVEQVNTAAGDKVTISAEAQALLSQKNADGTSATTQASNGVQKSAQAFFLGFFEDAGVDLGALSDEALELINGFNTVIAGSGSVQRDSSTDAMEEKYHKGDRDVYTLLGTDSRLRIVIDYQDDKPQKLTITDILGGNVQTASVTLRNAGDQAGTIELGREQREYANGSLLDVMTSEPLSLDLYR